MPDDGSGGALIVIVFIKCRCGSTLFFTKINKPNEK